MKKIVVLTGAGMSAESGIATFRDSNGLWENHKVEDVATPEGWRRNPELVLEFYNQRRRQLLECKPNEGHFLLKELEKWYDVQIVTQNVDDLHERAGSKKVLHLHGELLKVRSMADETEVYPWRKDLVLGDRCSQGSQLRPHIVWFGEAVPMMSNAILSAAMADIFIVVGTSLQVYPAAGLMAYANSDIPYYFVDKKPELNYELRQMKNLITFADTASNGLRNVVDILSI